MKRVKMFNENWKDTILHPIDTAVKKRNDRVKKYIDQFKGDSELTPELKILKEALIRLETKDFYLAESQKMRFLGAMEAILIVNGLLQAGGKFALDSDEKSIFGYKYKTQEGYQEHIIRLSKKLLSDRGIL